MTLAAAEGEATAVMDLLDEFWFFRSSLIAERNKRDKREEEDLSTKGVSSVHELEFLRGQHKAVRKSPVLLRMPTLPVAAPRLQESFNSSYPKLRHSMSALDGCQSSYSSKNASGDLSVAGDLPPMPAAKFEKSDRYRAILHYIAREAYYRKTFKEKKWRSLSDLEYIEIQGLKDLGFLGTISDVQINNPCLYKARPPQRSAPPMFRWVDRKSADDMKDQLRYWAKAVATTPGCNDVDRFRVLRLRSSEGHV